VKAIAELLWWYHAAPSSSLYFCKMCTLNSRVAIVAMIVW
jgi:hypothetical protein